MKSSMETNCWIFEAVFSFPPCRKTEFIFFAHKTHVLFMCYRRQSAGETDPAFGPVGDARRLQKSCVTEYQEPWDSKWPPPPLCMLHSPSCRHVHVRAYRNQLCISTYILCFTPHITAGSKHSKWEYFPMQNVKCNHSDDVFNSKMCILHLSAGSSSVLELQPEKKTCCHGNWDGHIKQSWACESFLAMVIYFPSEYNLMREWTVKAAGYSNWYFEMGDLCFQPQANHTRRHCKYACAPCKHFAASFTIT